MFHPMRIFRVCRASLLSRASWRFFVRHPWQLWLTLLSIALGTAVIIAVDTANQSAAYSFQRSVETLAGDMSHEITARRGRVSDAFYRQLRVEWSYRSSRPQLEVNLSKDGLQYTLIGSDPFSGSFPGGAAGGLSADVFTALLTRNNSVIIAEQLAERLQLDRGDILKMAGAGGDHQLEIIAVVTGLADSNTLYTDIATAQTISAEPGLSRIQLTLTDKEAAALTARLPNHLLLSAYQAEQQVFGQMTAAFSTNLMAMSLLAMLVGAFLVYNTMTFSILQRRQSLAVYRMVGVTGKQLFVHALSEALVLGLVGSLLGVVLGVFMAQGLLLLVSQTINDLFIEVTAADLLISPWLLAKGVVITLLAVLIATLAPAFEAARVRPVVVHRQSSLAQGSKKSVLYLLLAGLVLFGLSLLVLALSQRSLVMGFVGLFLLILGYSLCVPFVLRVVLAGLQRFSRHSHLVVRMTVRGVQASLSRTSLAIIALTVAVAATVGVSIMIGSFRSSVADWLEMTLSSDLYVSASSMEIAGANGALHPDWLPRLRELPEVASVSSGRTAELLIDGQSVSALVLEPGAHSANGFEYLAGDAEQIWADYLAGAGILVSEPFAYHRKQQAGDQVIVQTELAGPQAMTILGVFRDYSSTQGMISMPRPLYERYWSDRSRSSLGIKLLDQANLAEVLMRLEQWSAELALSRQPVLIRSNQSIREFSLGIFDRTFAVTHVLRVLVIIVAFVGVFSALMALFMERSREFGVFRAVGFTPAQLGILIVMQTAIMGLLAGLLALPLGWLMSDVLIDIINRRSFGWTMQSYFFAWLPVQAVLLASVAALLAGIYPVYQIVRLRVRESLYA